MLNLQYQYKNDAILLQYCAVYLSLKIINEVSQKFFTQIEINKIRQILLKILNMNQNIKIEGQKFHYSKFSREIIEMALSKDIEDIDLKCLKNFVFYYLQDGQPNLDYLLELKTKPNDFRKEYAAYKNIQKDSKNQNLIKIIEQIISNFLNNTIENERMNVAFYKVFSEDKIKNRFELEEENKSLLLKIKNIIIERDKLFSEKNSKISEAHKMINGFQQKEKELKKTIKSLEKDKQSLINVNKDFKNTMDLMMKNIAEIKEQEKAKDNKMAELSQKYEELGIQNMKQNSDLKNEISRLSNEIVDLRKDISKLSDENIIKDLKIEALNIECDNLFSMIEGNH